MTTATTPRVPRHPAKYSQPILERLQRMLAVEVERVGALKVLDPFAGVGGIHDLAEERIETYGVEIQPEWAAAHERTIRGDVLELTAIFPPATFDVLCTSPSYGNRMSDSHDARETCSACNGTGVESECSCRCHRTEGMKHVAPCCYPGRACLACDGKGRRSYQRNTYAHALREAGAEPAPGENSAVMAWGAKYRDFHERAWRQCATVVRPGGLVLVNVSNHIRGGEEIRVVEFHLNAWLLLGCTVEEVRRVDTRRNGQGANRDLRVGGERILALRLPGLTAGKKPLDPAAKTPLDSARD